MSELILRARVVFPGDGPPMWGGGVAVERGRIVGVLAAHQAAGTGAVDLGNVALVPGLVNAHTHLEFSDVKARIGPSEPFTQWLRAVVEHRRGMPELALKMGVTPDALGRYWREQGELECRESGTAVVGDIVTGAAADAEDDAREEERGGGERRPRLRFGLQGVEDPRLRCGLQAVRGESDFGGEHEETLAHGSGDPCYGHETTVVAFRESLGLRRERGAEELTKARAFLAADGPTRIRGVSPHAPYSVHPELFRGLVDLAVEFNAPVAMHLAETPGELQLLERGDGEFVEFLKAMGVWDPLAIPRGTRILAYLHVLSRARRGLVIHGNYLSDDEVRYLAEHPQLTVVYCPRTHAYFGRAPHPWQQMLASGVSVALGTDSRASNPDLSLWNELRFLRARHPEVNPAKLLELGTLAGAGALGLEKSYGSLTVGKRAVFAVAPLPARESSDPHELLFTAETLAALQL